MQQRSIKGARPGLHGERGVGGLWLGCNRVAGRPQPHDQPLPRHRDPGPSIRSGFHTTTLIRHSHNTPQSALCTLLRCSLPASDCKTSYILVAVVFVGVLFKRRLPYSALPALVRIVAQHSGTWPWFAYNSTSQRTPHLETVSHTNLSPTCLSPASPSCSGGSFRSSR